MSRLKLFSRNLATSYLQLGVNVVYSLAAIPLILHWLPKAEFGLWAMLAQLVTYVSVVDLGMTTAVARLLVDHKDRRQDGGYGALIQTAFLVSFTQGVIIVAGFAVGAPALAALMKIPADYQQLFINLLRWQGVIAAFGFWLRPLPLMLAAHQRTDVCSVAESLSAVTSLGLLVLFLAKGCGVYSFLYANGIGTVVLNAWLYWHGRRLGFWPRATEWGRASWKMFTEVFGYGKDVFLVSLGGQLVMSSQTIIVSRFLGLDMAAVWAVGTKVFNLCMSLVLRPLLVSMPALAEMVVRQESERLRGRFQDLTVLIASLGVFLGISYALCNSLFVGVWTHGRIFWPAINDALLAGWLILISMQTVHCNFVLVTKQIRGARYILIAEGVGFVLLAGLLGARWGVPGIVGCSFFCTAVFSYQYSVRRTQEYFGCGLSEVALQWVRPSLKLALTYAAVAGIVWAASAGLAALPRLCLHAVVAVVAGGILFLRLGCPPQMMQELAGRLPRFAGQGLRRLARVD